MSYFVFHHNVLKKSSAEEVSKRACIHVGKGYYSGAIWINMSPCMIFQDPAALKTSGEKKFLITESGSMILEQN